MRVLYVHLYEQNVTGLPIVGAGGFATGGGLVASLALGADGIAMGSRLVLSYCYLCILYHISLTSHTIN
jgi:NAD(P)H-dependent flavin oxidoreductase YrpB (nitropropane dioxygenase family)